MTATAPTSLERELKALLSDDAVLPGTTRGYLSDATESRNLRGRADAVALPRNAEEVAKTVAGQGGSADPAVGAAAIALHEAIKRAFDPKGLLNPRKKLARA